MAKPTRSDRIRQAREARFMSLSELARRVAVKPATAWQWENRGVNPRMEVIPKLAEVLGVAQEWLLMIENASGDAPALDVQAQLLLISTDDLIKAITKRGLEVTVRPTGQRSTTPIK